MSLAGYPSVKDQALTVEVHATGSRAVLVTFTGVLTPRDPGPLLQPFFDKLHKALMEQERKSVQVDLCGLRFMNSASFKHFVSWVKANSALPPERRYAIHFLVSRAHHWQSVSINALRCFSIDEISAETVEGEKK